MIRALCVRLGLARPPPMAAPPAELFDDAITEILLRLPPDDPACLVRTSLVCKLWRRILSDSTFLDRYREFHRTPPLLGFVCPKSSRFVNITKAGIPFIRPPFKCRALDCRHGRLLLDAVDGKMESLAVWDPVTGDHKLFADPGPVSYGRSGVVLCAAAGCNHRACHGGPFVVVLVSSSLEVTKNIRAWMYSSESEAWWSAPASMQLPEKYHMWATRGALVGDQIYFLVSSDTRTGILKYDLEKHCMNMISLPPSIYIHRPVLMAMEDGSLGLADVKDSTLHLWARKVNLTGSMGWVDRAVSLKNLAPIITLAGSTTMNVIAFAEGVDSLLLGDHGSGYMFELKSGRFKKLSDDPEYHYYDVLPYLSFYIPDVNLKSGVNRNAEESEKTQEHQMDEQMNEVEESKRDSGTMNFEFQMQAAHPNMTTEAGQKRGRGRPRKVLSLPAPSGTSAPIVESSVRRSTRIKNRIKEGYHTPTVRFEQEPSRKRSKISAVLINEEKVVPDEDQSA